MFDLGVLVHQKNIGKTPAIDMQNSPYEIIAGPNKTATKRAMNYIPDYRQSGVSVVYIDISMVAAIHHSEDAHFIADQMGKLSHSDFAL